MIYFLTLLIVMTGSSILLVIPPKINRFVISHDFAIMSRIFKLVCIDKQRNIFSLEGGEHAGNGGYMNIFDLELDLK